MPILVLWLALFLRVWQLDTLPPGLYYDEAFNGTMARDVLRGNNRPIFFTANNGEEPLHIYTEALLFEFLGESPWTIRLVSALFGVIFVAALYACARAFLPGSNLLALSAAFIAATLYWAINFSRYGIESNGLPMLLTLSAAALALAYRKPSWGWFGGSGFLVGATIYTYLASRLWLLAIPIWFLFLLVLHRSTVRATLSKWIVLGIVLILTLAPLVLFFITHPDMLNMRTGQIFAPKEIVINTARVARGFFLVGDSEPKDNLSRRPALDIVLALLFVTGVVLALTRFRKPLYALLLIWFGVMLLPSILTNSAPNFRRMIGAMPAMVLFCALGLDWLWHKLGRLSIPTIAPRATERLVSILLIAALVVSAYWSTYAYFVEWGKSSDLYDLFNAGLLQLGQALKARPSGESLFLSPYFAEHYTMLWALDGRPITSFDGGTILVLPDPKQTATYGIVTHNEGNTLPTLEHSFGNPTVLQEIQDDAGNPYATILNLSPNSFQASPVPAFGPVRAGDFATLTGVGISNHKPTRGNGLQIKLQWQAQVPTPKNYAVSVRVVGPLNPDSGSVVWAQADKPPYNDFFPTSRWETGQTVIETYNLNLPAKAAAGDYQVQVKMVFPETGEHVPLTQSDGTRVPDDILTVFSFPLH